MDKVLGDQETTVELNMIDWNISSKITIKSKMNDEEKCH